MVTKARSVTLELPNGMILGVETDVSDEQIKKRYPNAKVIKSVNYQEAGSKRKKSDQEKDDDDL